MSYASHLKETTLLFDVLSICALILSTISLIVAAFSLIEVKAMQRSTHQVMMLDPSKQEFSKFKNKEMDDVYDAI